MDQSELERLATAELHRRRHRKTVGGGEDDAIDNVAAAAPPPPLDEIAQLKQQIERAKRERSRLLLQKKPSLPSTHHGGPFAITTVGSSHRHRHRNASTTTSSSSSSSTALMQRAKLLRLGEQLSSFRLAGVSAFSVGGRPLDLGLRFDGTFGGQLLDDKYYVILTTTTTTATTTSQQQQLSVYRHTLPHFVPLGELARVFLRNDPAQFVRRVSRYVCAFAQRRVLAQRLGEEFKGQARLTDCSQAFDIITLQGRLEGTAGNRRGGGGGRSAHSVQLKFNTVLDVLPNQAVLTYLTGDGRTQVSDVVLDHVVEPDIAVMDQYLDYALWVRTVLDHTPEAAAAPATEQHAV